MTEPQTPIRMMQAAMLYIELSMPEGEQRSQYSADARAALEDVEALAKAAERVRYLMDEGEEQMKTAAWTIAWNDATGALRTALAKFQGQS